MIGFKEFFDDSTRISPSVGQAIVSKAENPALEIIQGTLAALPKAENILLKMYNDLIKESYFSRQLVIDVIENVLETDTFKNYVKTNFGDIKPENGDWGYKHSCGDDSCAFFFTGGYVFKFLGGKKSHQEYEISKSVLGSKLFPIKDVVEFDTSSGDAFYCVVMKKLDTENRDFPSVVRKAASLVANSLYVLQSKVEDNPNTPVQSIKNRLTPRYIMRDYSGDNEELVQEAVIALLRIIRRIYKNSGYLVGADIEGGRNIGLTKKNRIMIYDLGRPDRHELAYRNVAKKPDKILDI